MKGVRLLLLSVIFSLTVAQQNYQIRNLWVDPDDNPCLYGSGTKDKVNLVVNVSDKETIKVTVESSTYCDPNMLIPMRAIKPSSFIEYRDNKAGHRI